MAQEIETAAETWEQRENRERERIAALQEREMAMRERALDQSDRQIAAIEKQAGAMDMISSSPAASDGPLQRLQSFFDAPPEQQDFRLREQAISLALRISTTVPQAVDNADQIIAYIKGTSSRGVSPESEGQADE